MYRRGAAVRNIWGFIDGTIKFTCRPGEGQRAVFSGHKRAHGLKYQHVMCPNGLIAHSYGPFPGRRHDSFIFAESNLEMLLQNVTDAAGNQMALYGDSGYPIRDCLMVPFRGAHLSAEEQIFNNMMSGVRTCVEWGFGKVSSVFAFVNYYANQKILLQELGSYFQVATLLTNCHTCAYGSESPARQTVHP